MTQSQLPTRVLDAEVRYGPVPPVPEEAWSNDEGGLRVWATADEVWTRTEAIDSYVRGTDLVIVDLATAADPGVVEPWLHGWVSRILFLHGGTFNLHGSLVRIGDRHVVIGGHSGAGKSTTVSALAVRHGATLLVDDVVPARVVDGVVTAFPFVRPVNLMLDTIERLGIEADGSRIGDGPYQKRAIDLTGSDADLTPVAIDELVVLVGYDPDPHEDWPNTILPLETPSADRPVAVTPVTGTERLRWIVRLANNRGVAAVGDRAGAFFEWSTALADRLPTVEIARLRSADTLEDVCGLIIEGDWAASL